jgi:hypothetical protein
MKAIVISLLLLIGGNCNYSPPFEYKNETRIVVEGKLVNEDMTPLANQSISLMSFHYDNKVEINKTLSDSNGNFLISAPKGNNGMYIVFRNKKIKYTTNYFDLVNSSETNDEDWFGFLPNSYYGISIIILKDKI